MAGSEQHYQVLGLKPGASPEEIKRAYRDMALTWHPDRFAGAPDLRQMAEQKMRDINAAYAYLQDMARRVNGVEGETACDERRNAAQSRARRSQPRTTPTERGPSVKVISPGWRWQGPDRPTSVALSMDGRTARAGGHGLYVWDIASGIERRDLRIDKGGVVGLCVSPCGRYLIYGYSVTIFGAAERREVRLCDADSGKVRTRLKGLRGRLTATAFSANGEEVVTGDSAGELSLWASASGQRIRQMTVANAPGGVHRVAFCDGADRLVSLHRGEVQEQIGLWNARTGTLAKELTVHIRDSRRYGQIQDIAPSPDGRWLLVANNDPLRHAWSLHLWDMSTDREVRDFAGHEGRITHIDYASTGRWALSTGEDRVARLWDIETGVEICRLTGSARALTAATLSRDCHLVCGAGAEGATYLWRLPSGLQQRLKNV